MTDAIIEDKVKEILTRYNPERLAPFPFKNILDDKQDLRILFSDKLDEDVSGVSTFYTEQSLFIILINKNKPDVRQNFTIAHELGHYFLHQDIIKSEELLVTRNNTLESSSLYRLDDAEYSRIETEANKFAAALLMPKDLVLKAWSSLSDVEECAKIFKVSVSAMSIRLERLGLLE